MEKVILGVEDEPERQSTQSEREKIFQKLTAEDN